MLIYNLEFYSYRNSITSDRFILTYNKLRYIVFPCNYCLADVSIPADMKLRCVVIFFRHGARTPLTHIKAFDDVCYDPNLLADPSSEMDIPVQVVGLNGGQGPINPDRSRGFRLPGGMTAGELTTHGRRQSHEFGRSLAVKYMSRLGMTKERFVPREVFVRAKCLNRTVDTARCVLAGMYPKTAFQGNAVSIYVAATPQTDILKPNRKIINSAEALTSKVMGTSPGYVQIIQHIQQEIGDTRTPVDKFNFKQVHDNIASASEHGLLKPQWARNLESEIHRIAMASLHLIYDVNLEAGSRSLVQLAGPLLSEVGRCFRTSLEDPNSPRLFLYACSDSTLLPMLFALSCFDDRWPGFLSDLIFELYQDQRSTFWVRVIYRGKVKVIGGMGSSLISYHQFLKILAPYISTTGGYITKYYHTAG